MSAPRIRTDYSARMEALRASRGNRCELRPCPSVYRLEFAHVKATGCCGRGRGLRQRVLDIEENPDCYRLLCRYHHRDFDAGRRWTLRAVASLPPVPPYTPKKGKRGPAERVISTGPPNAAVTPRVSERKGKS